MLLSITLNLPVIDHFSEGFKGVGRLHCQYLGVLFFFNLTNKSLFLLQVKTMFVCLKECVEIMDDFNFYCYKHTALKVENLKSRVKSNFPDPIEQTKISRGFVETKTSQCNCGKHEI